ncbi:MAG: MFS transporter [Desulfatibacillaceae bacterium]|nr:MFS transporter [Desulfatibacillaceae bacterium]
MIRLPRTIWALGLISFFNDFASEMIYPLLPVFLSVSLGAGAAVLGIVEGIAESASSILKLVFGRLSDRLQKVRPFILGGYGLSGFVRPLIGIAVSWPVVMVVRFADRVGKGMRTSPRDALIASAAPLELRGRAYGFHRAMDHAGAVAGPLAAALLLSVFGMEIRQVFLLAAVPAVLVFLLVILWVKEPARVEVQDTGGQISLTGWKSLDHDYRRLLFALVIFTLGNSTDAFILLRLSHAGVPAAFIAVLWSLHHVVKSVSTYFGGRLSDRLGRRRLIRSGWLLYSLVYLCFAFLPGTTPLIIVFLVYGVYYGLAEPCEKAWVADLARTGQCGTAFGYYHGVVGLAALPASILFGWIWHIWGMAFAFSTGAIIALAASLLLPAEYRGRAIA